MAAPRIGLVLGGGGILGAAWLAGALEGIRRATGFEVPDATLTVGTSAGAFIGAMLATGVPAAAVVGHGQPEDLPAHLRSLVAELDAHHDRPWLQQFPLHWRLPRPLLAAPGHLLRAWEQPELALAGLAGDGPFSGSRVARLVRSTARVLRERVAWWGWPRRPLWVVAVELDRGQRVVFGRDGPVVALDVAVRASTAIPGLFAPVRIGGRRHVDGGVWSPTNLDLLAGRGLDLVLCINPLSGGHQRLPRVDGPAWQRAGLWFSQRFRRRVDARLDRERALVEADGTPVLVLHPSAEEIAALPFHLMNAGPRREVMRRAVERVEAMLRRHREVRELLQGAVWR